MIHKLKHNEVLLFVTKTLIFLCACFLTTVCGLILRKLLLGTINVELLTLTGEMFILTVSVCVITISFIFVCKFIHQLMVVFSLFRFLSTIKEPSFDLLKVVYASVLYPNDEDNLNPWQYESIVAKSTTLNGELVIGWWNGIMNWSVNRNAETFKSTILWKGPKQ